MSKTKEFLLKLADLVEMYDVELGESTDVNEMTVIVGDDDLVTVGYIDGAKSAQSIRDIANTLS